MWIPCAAGFFRARTPASPTPLPPPTKERSQCHHRSLTNQDELPFGLARLAQESWRLSSPCGFLRLNSPPGTSPLLSLSLSTLRIRSEAPFFDFLFDSLSSFGEGFFEDGIGRPFVVGELLSVHPWLPVPQSMTPLGLDVEPLLDAQTGPIAAAPKAVLAAGLG